MKKEKKLEELRKELDRAKELNKSIWNIYGSELCGYQLSKEEEEIENEIKRLEKSERRNKKMSVLRNQT